jgi:hypothetical protein
MISFFKRVIRSFTFFNVVFFVSCGDSKLPKVEKIEKFRILAVADIPPEISPSTSVGTIATPRLLGVDPEGLGSLSGTVEYCFDPGISLGAALSCDHDSQKTTHTVSSFSFGFASIQTLTLTPALDVALPATTRVLFNSLNSIQQFNGYAMIVLFKLNLANQSYKFFKRVIVTSRSSLNGQNLIAPSILLNSAPISTRPQKGDTLSLGNNYSLESYQRYTDQGDLQAVSEKLSLAWYLTSGELTAAKVSPNESVELSKDSISTVNDYVIAVVRDDRGDVNFTISGPLP